MRLVEEDGDSQVILVGPGPNDFGATLGAVTVTNDFGSIDLTQPNFATVITPNAPPTTANGDPGDAKSLNLGHRPD